jgi:hypothetical protein
MAKEIVYARAVGQLASPVDNSQKMSSFVVVHFHLPSCSSRPESGAQIQAAHPRGKRHGTLSHCRKKDKNKK